MSVQQGDFTDAWFSIEQIDPGVWVLIEPHVDSVSSYLVVGDRAAVLIDTGLGIGDIRRAVEGITSLPLVVVNTHAHYDHIGGNHLFGGVAAHAAERRRIERGVPREELDMIADLSAFLAPAPAGFDPDSFSIPGVPVATLLDEGSVLDLGGRCLEVLRTPGHSPGSISLWDHDAGIVFVGDVIYKGNIFACLPGSDFRAYRQSVQRLSDLSPAPRLVLPGHGPTPLSHADVKAVAAFFEEVAAGAVPGRRGVSPWGPVVVYAGSGFNLLLGVR